ncbi:MAG TPA: MdtA/MuxA family multidrug efflux RND transporter periplasmic adaptor subunit [Tepidisphaeraceae bacterium]|jgi:multidrug efflux system membrane fusion protein
MPPDITPQSRRPAAPPAAHPAAAPPEPYPATHPQPLRPVLPYTEHPEPRARSHWWVWVIIIGVLGGGAFLLYRHTHATDSTEAGAAGGPGGRRGGGGFGRGGFGGGNRAMPVVAVPARQGDLPIYLTGLGTVTPLNTVTVRSRVDGQIDQVNFVEGQIIKQGELLVQIDPRPFQVQLAQAQGQLAKDRAALENAKVELERYKQAADAIPKQTLDTQQATVDQFEAATKIDQGQIDNAQLQLTYSKVTAPISGRIGLRLVDQGNIIHANDAGGLAVITQLQPISVVFTLSQDTIPQIMRRMSAAGSGLEVDAFDRDIRERLATGTLSAIDNQVDPNSGTIRLKASFPNTDNSLFPNQFVNARLLVDTRRGAILAPVAAVQRGPNDQPYVYVVKADETVEVRNVVTGPSEGDLMVIESGLQPGEVVVTDGVDKLQPGAKVTVRSRNATTQPGGTTRPGATTRPGGGNRQGQYRGQGQNRGPGQGGGSGGGGQRRGGGGGAQ